MATQGFKLHYRGSVFWLIFWCIFFFPIAFVLLLTAFSFDVNEKSYNITYEGSRFWLGFWVLVFFPVAILLLLINGLGISIEDKYDQTGYPTVKS